MQYSPRVRSPLSAIENIPAPSTSGDGVFKKPLAPAMRVNRADVPARERSGSSAGISTMPSRLTRSSSSIEAFNAPAESARRGRATLLSASNAIPIPSSPPPSSTLYPSLPAVTTVVSYAPSVSPPSAFNMAALNANLPVASNGKAVATPAPDSPDQTMDFDKLPVFPTITNSEVPDFPCLSPDTLADLINGKIATHISRVILVDCRFEYEYQGGHVKSAINLHTEELVERAFTRALLPGAENVAIIFYCEFSSYRGPRLCRFLRSWDRKMNLDRYPKLHYENLFVLKGGYKNFFTHHPELCDPMTYLPMSDPRYAEQCSAGLASCKKQRPTRSYSWSGLSQPMF